MNNTSYQAVPLPLKGLTDLEEMLIALVVPFMRVQTLPRGGQLSLRGGVINVVSDIQTTQKALKLPRTQNGNNVVFVTFKRNMAYCSDYTHNNVRAERVQEALQYLVNN